MLNTHEKAFLAKKPFYRISICKFLHDIIPTNYLQHKYDGSSDLCHFCKQASETAYHLLSCPSSLPTVPTEHWQTKMHSLETRLSSIEPPTLIMTFIVHRIKSYLSPPSTCQYCRAHSFGLVHPLDMLVNQCFAS
jgi:hypothetical protein